MLYHVRYMSGYYDPPRLQTISIWVCKRTAAKQLQSLRHRYPTWEGWVIQKEGETT